MRIPESLWIENDKRGYQELCPDCEAYGLKKKARINEVQCPFINVDLLSKF